jgi:hypothetical protein
MSDESVPATEYAVTAHVRPPAAADALDDGQRDDVALVLKELLDHVDSVVGPDGSSILVDSCWAGVFPGGALILIAVHALSLEAAEGGVRAIVGEVLERSEVLSEWTVKRCEVSLNRHLVEAAQRTAEEGASTPDEPAERVHGHPSRTSGPGYLVEDEEAWGERVAGYARAIRAFDAAAFDPADEQRAALAAGALTVASTMFIDELIEDINTLAEHGATVASSRECLLALGELPWRLAAGYDGRFARKFLVAAIMVTGRLSASKGKRPACLGEALALHLVVRRAEQLLLDHGRIDEEEQGQVYADFEARVLDGFDLASLYPFGLGEHGGGEDLIPRDLVDASLLSWFSPVSQRRIHLFMADAEEEDPGE